MNSSQLKPGNSSTLQVTEQEGTREDAEVSVWMEVLIDANVDCV